MRENTVKFKQIQESDHGNYSCQINTDPVTIKTGYLEVKGRDFYLKFGVHLFFPLQFRSSFSRTHLA